MVPGQGFEPRPKALSILSMRIGFHRLQCYHCAWVITSLHLRELVNTYQHNPGTVPRHEEMLNQALPQKAFLLYLEGITPSASAICLPMGYPKPCIDKSEAD